MDSWRLNRRQAVGGLALAGLLPAAAQAAYDPMAHLALRWTDAPAFVSGPLAADPIARRFHAPRPETVWPEDTLLGVDGPRTISAWRGKTLLVTLWAEWCAPCVAEMPALSRLNAKYRSKTFEILPIVTGSHTIATPEQARERLARLPGADIDSLVDGGDGGQRLYATLATMSTEGMKPPPGLKMLPGATLSPIGTSLPCLILVDPAGRLRGRVLGLPMVDRKSTWELPTGDAFIKLLASGALAA